MVQKEVRKKTRIYGTIAFLSAIVLVTLIYAVGTAPVTFPPTQMPFVSDMKTFTSYEELRDYLVANTVGVSGPVDAKYFAFSPQLSAGESARGVWSYSTTNIQVAGVDEADIVKSDGRHVYLVSNVYGYPETQSRIYIVKADPQDQKVVAKIAFENYTCVAGIYLSGDSSRLAIIASKYQPAIIRSDSPDMPKIYPYQSEVVTFLYVYDISKKAYPVLARNFTISGSYFNSRMISNYVYVVVSQPAYVIGNTVTLPKVYETTKAVSKASEVAPSNVYHADTIPSYFAFTTFVCLNILDDAQQPTNLTLLMGGTSSMYVSMDNIYVTYPTWTEDGQFTSIYRVRINRSSLTFEAKGSVAGYVLNQYSMDEHNGYFRLTTTWQKETTLNYVFVLDMNLTKVGELLLPKFEQRETIQSTRFMGDKCYVVTFEQKDPFFVIDLANPAKPKVAGALKIPGYSSYLHPFDENHVIGVGKENNTVKLSLFDVTNVNAPTEIFKYLVGGDYADSEVLYEPKAFLFDKEKELLVIPVLIHQYGPIAAGTIDPSGKELDFSTQSYIWQGAYVFKLTVTGGFELRGYGITHQENITSQRPYPMYGIDDALYVKRALYVGNTLYTVSNAKVQLNRLDTLVLIAEINLR